MTTEFVNGCGCKITVPEDDETPDCINQERMGDGWEVVEDEV